MEVRAGRWGSGYGSSRTIGPKNAFSSQDAPVHVAQPHCIVGECAGCTRGHTRVTRHVLKSGGTVNSHVSPRRAQGSDLCPQLHKTKRFSPNWGEFVHLDSLSSKFRATLWHQQLRGMPFPSSSPLRRAESGVVEGLCSASGPEDPDLLWGKGGGEATSLSLSFPILKRGTSPQNQEPLCPLQHLKNFLISTVKEKFT